MSKVYLIPGDVVEAHSELIITSNNSIGGWDCDFNGLSEEVTVHNTSTIQTYVEDKNEWYECKVDEHGMIYYELESK